MVSGINHILLKEKLGLVFVWILSNFYCQFVVILQLICVL